MNPIVLLGAFFVLLMGAITLTGYAWFYRTTGDTGLIKQTLLRVGEAVPGRPTRPDRYQRQLILAGYRQANTPSIFFGIKIALGAFVALACGVGRMLLDPSVTTALVAMIAGAGIGYLLPDRILEYLVRRRARSILFGIPTAIDLLVLSLEAGQSIDSAMVDTAREIRAAYPELGNELSLVQVELLANRGRPEVFRSLRDRNSEPELKRLAQVFIDSDRFGTSLAPALRNHVRFLRQRLRQQAYEKARKVSVKLVFPVFFLIFPAVVLVTLGPALLQVYSQLDVLLGK